MSRLNRGEVRAYARMLAKQDTALSSTETSEINAVINEAHAFVWAMHGPRMGVISGATGAAEAPGTSGLQLSGLGATPDDNWAMTTASVSIEEIMQCMKGAEGGTVLEKLEYHELLELRRQSQSTDGNGPTHYCAIRVANDGLSATAVGKWRVMVHPPIPDQGISGVQQYMGFSILVRTEKRSFTIAGTTDDAAFMDVLPQECYLIARLAAYELASKNGRPPDDLDVIAELIPEAVRSARGIKLHAGVGVSSVDMESAQ